jgi:hypothetical protein
VIVSTTNAELKKVATKVFSIKNGVIAEEDK